MVFYSFGRINLILYDLLYKLAFIISIEGVLMDWISYYLPKENSKSIQSLKRSTFQLEPWANNERTVIERWTHAERTLSERRVNDVWTLNASWWTICERWTMSEHGTRTGRKRERNVNGERTVNVLFGKSRIFSLHCT